MGQTSFFVIDARSYRSSDDSVDDENKTMLQEQQLNDLFEHLLAVNSTAKFKVSQFDVLNIDSNAS